MEPEFKVEIYLPMVEIYGNYQVETDLYGIVLVLMCQKCSLVYLLQIRFQLCHFTTITI